VEAQQPDRRAFPSRMELTSPTYLAKKNVQTVQDYVLFCGQAVANLFRKPLYAADIVVQADAIGVGSLPIVVRPVTLVKDLVR